MTEQRRRLLLVAYFFPPLGGAGVQRPLKWAKYLPRHGWDAVVLTTRSRWYPVADETLAGDVPAGTEVIRARDPSLLRKTSWALSLARVPVLPHLLRLPDEELSWIPSAILRGLRAIRRRQIDVIVTTSSPYSAHVVGLVLKRVTGLPWVADFRDEWSLNPELGPQAWPTGQFAGWFERKVVARADALVVTSDAALLAGADRNHPKRVTITNGVDPDDARPAAPPARGERLRIALVGTMYSERNARPILDALGRLADRGEIDPDRVEFRVVGNVWLAQKPTAGRVPVVSTGYVDHAAAVDEMAAAHVLAVHLPSVSRAIPGKVFEYFAARRPILAVMHPDTPGFKLVQELGAGDALAPADSEGIEAALRARYQQWERGDPMVSGADWDETVKRFGRERLAGDLAALLNRLVRDEQVVGAQDRDAPQQLHGKE